MSILPNIPQGRELVGGWFDPNDVPPPVRDHLLDLFFSRNAANLVVDLTLHLPRFYMRLTLPPSKRPHPGLLYAIYATAARMSTQPGIKQLESQFFEIADKQLRISVANHDRLLDTVRGMTLLTSYLFAKEKYSLGYHMCGAAVRLAIACGLDRIPSSVWTAPPPFNAAIHCTLRTGGYSIPPPDDPVELAERIYAFWSVYEVDLCTAIAYLWHTGLPIEDVRTPFPRPLFEYELGLVSIQDDISLQSLLDPPPSGLARSADSSFIVLRMKALTLLARVLKLRQERPEVDSPPSPSAGPPTCSYPGSPAPAFATHPAGFVRIKRALDNYAAQLPQEHKAPWQWDEGENMTMPRVAISRESSVLHFLLGNAYMQLWNVRALDADNSVALLVARRLVNVMYLFQTEPMSTGYDIFMITIWNEVAMVLVREVKRLSHIGERARAAEVDSDLGVAIAAMKKWGDVDISNQHDGSDIAAINGKMLEQLRLMSEEDWAEAMAESSRRFGGTGGDSAGCEIPPVAIDRARGGRV
ncbi:hypothetical protein VHUM_02219 [Vanrija humicola]|uniref:Xylanolytic transcriptional activator regulatory domain-containing protein n=1 Tax=Vanrija humicola TaxID=5417 RepID=A0A7D8V1I8_VANHU|nr:hypothetical protein VHUM_02219 [Vanrija humicola]